MSSMSSNEDLDISVNLAAGHKSNTKAFNMLVVSFALLIVGDSMFKILMQIRQGHIRFSFAYWVGRIPTIILRLPFNWGFGYFLATVACGLVVVLNFVQSFLGDVVLKLAKMLSDWLLQDVLWVVRLPSIWAFGHLLGIVSHALRAILGIMSLLTWGLVSLLAPVTSDRLLYEYCLVTMAAWILLGVYIYCDGRSKANNMTSADAFRVVL